MKDSYIVEDFAFEFVVEYDKDYDKYKEHLLKEKLYLSSINGKYGNNEFKPMPLYYVEKKLKMLEEYKEDYDERQKN